MNSSRQPSMFVMCLACLGLALIAAGCDGGKPPAQKFSFFVTSLKSMQELSGSQNGFGGDLRYGETGAGAGLRGADKICRTVAEKSLAGSGTKTWRAFLSAKADETGAQVNAIDRIGNGPWYDRKGRLFAPDKPSLLNARPAGADATIQNDFPNENGVLNHNPDGTGEVDNQGFLTGSNAQGQYLTNATCVDWTSASADKAATGRPRIGSAWPSGGVTHWMSSYLEAGCAAGVNLNQTGPPDINSSIVGSGGGYGGMYCFAKEP